MGDGGAMREAAASTALRRRLGHLGACPGSAGDPCALRCGGQCPSGLVRGAGGHV